MTSRLDLANDNLKLLELAKQTLGIARTSHDALPSGYLDELKKHVKFSKDDTHFRIFPQPGYDYGHITCLEQGCEGSAIKLTRRMGVVDGGLAEGIGSLSAFRVHVQEHPTHKANRFARVKAKNNSHTSSRINQTEPLPSQASLLTVKAATKVSHKHGAGSLLATMEGFGAGDTSSSNTKSNLSRLTSVKHEPSDSSSSFSDSSPIIPRKRHSMDEDTDVTFPSSSTHGSPAASKKPKMETVIPKSNLTPLGMSDINSPKSTGTSKVDVSSGSLMPYDARSLLISTNDTINTARVLLSHHRRKSRKSAHDNRRINELEKQLEECAVTKERCEIALQSTLGAAGSSSGNAAGVREPLYLDLKPYCGNPSTASGSKLQLPPAPPVSNVQLGIRSSTRAFPNTLPYLDRDVSPMTGLPNYGDTMDYELDDEAYGGRYRNRVAYRGPVADPGDIDKFLMEAGNSESFDGNESVDKALAKLGLKKLGEQLPSMSITLMPHQVIGVAWMLEHERGNHKGGILADEMGLGKTVQMIATMVQHRSDDPAVKSTLICAPLALLHQWKLEIETKTDGALSCLIYHGSNKPKLQKELQKYDVVLTTFQTLALEWPDHKAGEKRKKKKKKAVDSDDFIESDSRQEKKVKKKGLLLKMKWFRVVLDEAQNIRNRNTRISNAVTFLDVEHRWCLTGTPVTNTLADCYAFMRFLEIRPWYDWQDYNSHIVRLERRQPDLASFRLQAILKACLIRRKKDSLLDGKKLIELPPKDVVLRKLIFSQDERDMYDAIEKKSQAIINKYLRAGTILKNYTHVLVLLLRLRQLCSHPCLIQEGGDAFLLPGEDATVKHEVQTELDRATILAGKEFVASMKEKLKTVLLQRMAAEKASAKAMIEEDECPICFDTMANPVVTRCFHAFCADCIDAVMKQPPVEDGNEPQYAISERPCPTCRSPVQKEMIFQRGAFEPTDAELDSSSTTSPIIVDDDGDGLPTAAEVLAAAKKKPPTKGKGRRKKRFTERIADSDEDYEDDEDDSDLSDFIVHSDEDEEEKDARRELKKKLAKNKRIVDSDNDTDDEETLLPPAVVARKKGKVLQRFLPSTKMKEMMVLLKEWAEAEETKNEKTMVLSQWTSCLDLVADYLEENGFTFVRYQGSMTRLARDEAVRVFMSQGKARIMLMSLKCGGVGLNLTRANRVISLDLGWSPAVESQAFDRVHRLGQARPVTVQRLVIEDTVETRILALQERKQNLADGSLGEGSGKKLGKLSVKDLANLFGLSARGDVL